MDETAFFFNLANTLTENLQNANEKLTANLWINKIKEISDDILRLKYIKMLIFSIQEDNSPKIFNKSPPENPNLLIEILENVSNSSESKKNLLNEEKPKIWTSISGDLREYCSIEQIDDSFTHGYYGISGGEPLFKNTLDLSDIKLTLSDDELKIDEIDEIDEFLKSNKINENIEKSCKCSDKPQKYASNKNRPCWGWNRYIERLIDQTPHSIGDLDAIAVNAMLHKFQNRKKPKNH